MEVGPTCTTSWAASASTRIRPPRRCRASSRPASARVACTARTGLAETRFRTCSCSACGRAQARRSTRRGLALSRQSTTARLMPSPREMLAHFERDGKENPYALQHDLQETMHKLVGIIRTESELQEALAKIRELKERAARYRRRREPPVQPRLAPRDGPALAARRLGGDHARGHRTQGEPRGAYPGRLSQRRTPEWGK